jgi:diguanylate cyclase (GGDEF)-like protein/PAS domain S-box-containing protein
MLRANGWAVQTKYSNFPANQAALSQTRYVRSAATPPLNGGRKMKSTPILNRSFPVAVILTIAAAGLTGMVLYAVYGVNLTAIALILALIGAGIGGWVAARRGATLRSLSREVEGVYLDEILGYISDAVVMATSDGTIVRINHSASTLLGYDEKELLGQPLNVLFSMSSEQFDEIFGDPKKVGEASFQTRGGHDVPVSYTFSRISGPNESQPVLIVVFRNIEDRMQVEQRIRNFAQTDALTKIPNRNQIHHLLRRAIARARREQQALALLQLDIDRFKDINDTYGHSAGDATLEAVVERLTGILPDGTLIGRFAGDAFAIVAEGLAPGAEAHDSAATMARQIVNSLREVFLIHGHHLHMTASIGIAIYPEDGARAMDLSRNGDLALYEAKRRGGDDFAFYDPDTNQDVAKRLLLKSKLRQSFENNELLLYYQPRVDIRDGRIIGAEALLRWELPGQGIVLPSEFIPLAEETKLILEIGEWVLERVCTDYRHWQKSLAIPGRISANLSLLQLRQPDFAGKVRSICRKHGVSPSCLELEITETTLMDDSGRTIRVLRELHDLGLYLAIDDFGTGYSSLSAVQQFPINTLKIDRSFVSNAAMDSDDATIVAAIIEMGRKLHIDVVAEGVESEQQLEVMRKLNCNLVQGLLFGEPMTAADFHELMSAQQRGTNTYEALIA